MKEVKHFLSKNAKFENKINFTITEERHVDFKSESVRDSYKLALHVCQRLKFRIELHVL